MGHGLFDIDKFIGHDESLTKISERLPRLNAPAGRFVAASRKRMVPSSSESSGGRPKAISNARRTWVCTFGSGFGDHPLSEPVALRADHRIVQEVQSLGHNRRQMATAGRGVGVGPVKRLEQR